MRDWQDRTPREVLDGCVVLSPAQVAYVLGLTFAKGSKAGRPDPAQVFELVARNRLRPVDPEQPSFRWTFSARQIAQYIEHGDGLLVLPVQVA